MVPFAEGSTLRAKAAFSGLVVARRSTEFVVETVRCVAGNEVLIRAVCSLPSVVFNGRGPKKVSVDLP